VPHWLFIVLAVLLVLAVGGAIARALRQRRTEAQFRARLEQANQDLAEAAAADRGWDRSNLEAAARRIYVQERGSEPAELVLVEVLDRPGTDEDQAVFHCSGEGARHALTLGRRDGEWVLEALA
jgi:Tfp pilus assembly protein PilX